MSANQNPAGTGNETASQAVTQAQEQSSQSQQQQQPNAAPQGNGQAPAAAADPLAGLAPQTPEEAAKIGTETGTKKTDSQPDDAPVEIKLPEGFQKDDALMNGFLDAVKKGGVKQETAQRLFDMYAAEHKRMGDAFEKSVMDQRARINEDWARQCRNDPEFGGAKFDASCNHVIQAIRRFTPDPKDQAEFVEFYQRSNLQNAHPMWKFLVRVGMGTTEAGAVQSDAAEPAKELSLADKLFPNFPSAKR